MPEFAAVHSICRLSYVHVLSLDLRSSQTTLVYYFERNRKLIMALFYLNDSDFTYFHRNTSLLYIFMQFSFGSAHFYRQSRCLFCVLLFQLSTKYVFFVLYLKSMCHYFKLMTAAEWIYLDTKLTMLMLTNLLNLKLEEAKVDLPCALLTPAHGPQL